MSSFTAGAQSNEPEAWDDEYQVDFVEEMWYRSLHSDIEASDNTVQSNSPSTRLEDDYDDDDDSPELPARKKRMRRRECDICNTEVAVNQFPKVAHPGARAHIDKVCFRC